VTPRRGRDSVPVVTDKPTREPLVLTETGIGRDLEGREVVNVGPIMAAIDWLTEGRSKEHMEVSILVFEAIQSIVTGKRLKLMQGLARDVADNRPLLYVRVMGELERAARPAMGLPPAPPELIADSVKAMLAALDPAFRGLDPKEVAHAISEVRSRPAAVAAEAARLSVLCGAFEMSQRKDEDFVDALDRARKSYAGAPARVEALDK
jgi:hypothetical protein